MYLSTEMKLRRLDIVTCRTLSTFLMSPFASVINAFFPSSVTFSLQRKQTKGENKPSALGNVIITS